MMSTETETSSNPVGAAVVTPAEGQSPGARPATYFTRRQWWQIARISLVAIGIFLFIRHLPTGTYLSHMDFRVKGGNSIHFCDPLHPQFIPVVSVRSPVTLAIHTPPARAGEMVHATLTLKTASGKPIGPEDLLVVHTKKLHLLVADPSLTDYQHEHPQPTETPGEWSFSFRPHFGGRYRIFADFTPVATGLGLYANTELQVIGPAAPPEPTSMDNTWRVERDGYRYVLFPSELPIRVGRTTDLRFVAMRLDGGRVPLGPIMGAYAHLVAFDEACSGFAHLHPTETDLSKPPDAIKPVLHFKIMIPKAGRYVIWAQLNLGGRQTFIPFWFDVVE